MKQFYLRDVTRRNKQEPLLIVSAGDKETGQAGLARISFYDILQYTPETVSSGLPLNKCAYHEYLLNEEVSFTLARPHMSETITIIFSREQGKIVIQEENSGNISADDALFDILQHFGMVKATNLSFFTILPQKGKVPVKEKDHRTLAAHIKREPER